MCDVYVVRVKKHTACYLSLNRHTIMLCTSFHDELLVVILCCCVKSYVTSSAIWVTRFLNLVYLYPTAALSCLAALLKAAELSRAAEARWYPGTDRVTNFISLLSTLMRASIYINRHQIIAQFMMSFVVFPADRVASFPWWWWIILCIARRNTLWHIAEEHIGRFIIVVGILLSIVGVSVYYAIRWYVSLLMDVARLLYHHCIHRGRDHDNLSTVPMNQARRSGPRRDPIHHTDHAEPPLFRAPAPPPSTNVVNVNFDVNIVGDDRVMASCSVCQAEIEESFGMTCSKCKQFYCSRQCRKMDTKFGNHASRCNNAL
jgi:hypothetical protein